VIYRRVSSADQILKNANDAFFVTRPLWRGPTRSAGLSTRDGCALVREPLEMFVHGVIEGSNHRIQAPGGAEQLRKMVAEIALLLAGLR
jgi:hypothetical protein